MNIILSWNTDHFHDYIKDFRPILAPRHIFYLIQIGLRILKLGEISL